MQSAEQRTCRRNPRPALGSLSELCNESLPQTLTRDWNPGVAVAWTLQSPLPHVRGKADRDRPGSILYRATPVLVPRTNSETSHETPSTQRWEVVVLVSSSQDRI